MQLETITYTCTYTGASKQGRYMAAAGATSSDLLEISNKWLGAGRTSSMFFV
jgi:hypothetical protein